MSAALRAYSLHHAGPHLVANPKANHLRQYLNHEHGHEYPDIQLLPAHSQRSFNNYGVVAKEAAQVRLVAQRAV